MRRDSRRDGKPKIFKMPYTDQGLPFSGRSPLARSCSHKAAVRVASKRGPKTDLYLRILAVKGPQIDHGAYALMKMVMPLAFSSIQSIRNSAIDCGLVRDSGETAPGPFDHPCTKWELTEAGKAAVEKMAERERRRPVIQRDADGSPERILL